MLRFISLHLLLGCLFSFYASSSAPQWLWTRGISTSGTSSCYAYGITHDAAGNVLEAAAIQGTVTVGTLTFTSRGANDVLVSSDQATLDVGMVSPGVYHLRVVDATGKCLGNRQVVIQ